MQLITKEDLGRWADTVVAEEQLPHLISRLIRGTTPPSTKVDIPFGNAIYLPGWDGIVDCEEERSYVPRGISLWEFSTSKKYKDKANENYEKRKGNPLGKDSKDAVFIFVTPRLWSEKKEWCAARNKEKIWKKVLIYDATDLIQWLDFSIPVLQWFAAQENVGKYSFEEMMIPEEFWKGWSKTENFELLPGTIISGRENQQQQLLSTFRKEPAIKAIKASTREEVIAFIIASAKLFPPEESGNFFSKAIIVKSESRFQQLINAINSKYLIIPDFKDLKVLNTGILNGHHIWVPLGADDDCNLEIITLSVINGNGQIKSLVEGGVLEYDAERFSKESGKSITILKKFLGFPAYNNPEWVKKGDIREIIPALLLGRWNENHEGDIELIEKLSQQDYFDYKITLNKWKYFSDSPLINIENSWRLTSTFDLWSILFSKIKAAEFQTLKECFIIAFESGNPEMQQASDQPLRRIFPEKKKFSNWAREGLVQSLIMIGRMTAGDTTHPYSQIWVDDIVDKLLDQASAERWISVSHDLPFISEASPKSFLRAVLHSLESEDLEIMQMFAEDGFLIRGSSHTGLLWALEGLAWLPEYLEDVSLILLKLSRLDPGGSLTNRPMNSISEIFKPWHYQTFASYDERMKILKLVTEQEPESGWDLLINMLPDSYNQIASPTHKMRWRMFDMEPDPTPTYPEIWDTHSRVVDILISIFDGDEEKFSRLITKIPYLHPADTNKILDWANSILPQLKQKEYTTWTSIRSILSHHRSFPHAEWALPNSILVRLENLYNDLQPADSTRKYLWLFNEKYPKLPDGHDLRNQETKKEIERRQNQIDEARKTALIRLIETHGVEKTIELRKKCLEPFIFGNVMGMVIIGPQKVLEVCVCLNDEKKWIGFIHGFIWRKSQSRGFERIKKLFEKLRKAEFGEKALANVLIPLAVNRELWDFLILLSDEIQTEYWKNVNPNFYFLDDDLKNEGIRMLLKHKKYSSAIKNTSLYGDGILTTLLTDVLLKAAKAGVFDGSDYGVYEIKKIFGELRKRNDVERSTLIELEWIYLQIFGGIGPENPEILEEELASSPQFFVEILSYIYHPENPQQWEEEREKESEDDLLNRARQARHLLELWKKIPGMKTDLTVDYEELKKWVEEARVLADRVSRIKVADSQIGSLLARYPKGQDKWPQDAIFRIIEEYDSGSMRNGYSTEMYNKKGATWRGAYQGGDIERENARYYEKLANDTKQKFPGVSSVFEQMKKRYLDEAKSQDDLAELYKLEY